MLEKPTLACPPNSKQVDTMPSSVALLVVIVLFAGLLRYDPAREAKSSLVLWVPVIWMFINSSRLPSQWFGGEMDQAAQAMEEGNSLDRAFYSALMALAIAVLLSRSFRWGEFIRRNSALSAFLGFALVSAVWSDFPLIALKRWVRDLGDYLVILVILSDPRPMEAVRTVLRHLCYLLIPLSILFIKYYPELGIHYSTWTGAPEYVGVATSKNTLGNLCLVSGLAFFWDTATRWPNRKFRRTKQVILLNAAFLVMSMWLLHFSHSATSSVCLALGCLVIFGIHSKWGNRHRGVLKVLMPASFFLYLVLNFGFDMNAQFAQGLGRDPNLTGRTEIWENLLSLHTNPILGTGYESFWLGPRLTRIWQLCGEINEAHNGYLDIYLNLGLIGLFLLFAFLIAAYRTGCRGLDRHSGLTSLGMAAWTMLLFYSVTEAAFKNGMIWMTCLLGVLVIPASTARRAAPVAKGFLDESPARVREPVNL